MLLSVGREARRLAVLGAQITLMFALVLGFAATDLVTANAVLIQGIQCAAYLLFFALVAECGRTRAHWLVMQLTVFLLFCVVIGSQNAAFRSSGSMQAVWSGPPWQQAVYYMAFCAGGIIRLGALVEVMVHRAVTNVERLSYWVIIFLHLGLYFAVLGNPSILRARPLTANAIDNATLISQLSLTVQYCVTPLMLVHFSSLSHTHARAMVQRIDAANRKLAVADAATTARRECESHGGVTDVLVTVTTRVSMLLRFITSWLLPRSELRLWSPGAPYGLVAHVVILSVSLAHVLMMEPYCT